MKTIFSSGDQKQYSYVVRSEDFAAFHGAVVHPVMSTFALAREIEWSTRLFVLEMRDDDEEGIGTFVSVEHKGPAFEGERIDITATVETINGHELICSSVVRVGDRTVAIGKTGQKIMKRSKLAAMFGK